MTQINPNARAHYRIGPPEPVACSLCGAPINCFDFLLAFIKGSAPISVAGSNDDRLLRSRRARMVKSCRMMVIEQSARGVPVLCFSAT